MLEGSESCVDLQTDIECMARGFWLNAETSSQFVVDDAAHGEWPEGAGFQGLTRSVSDEDLAKIKLNNTLFEQSGLSLMRTDHGELSTIT